MKKKNNLKRNKKAKKKVIKPIIEEIPIIRTPVENKNPDEIPKGGWRTPQTVTENLTAMVEKNPNAKKLSFDTKTGELILGPSQSDDSVPVDQIYKDGFFNQPTSK